MFFNLMKDESLYLHITLQNVCITINTHLEMHVKIIDTY